MTAPIRLHTLAVAAVLAVAAALATGAAAAQEPNGEPPPGAAPAPDGDAFTLNFKEADISALIATISEITGRNFIVDPRVKGQVTLLSAHPMDADELYETFLAVLEVHGFATVPAGEVIKVIPQVTAKQGGGFGRDADTREDIVTRVLQVDNVPADQLVPILRPLVPQYGHLAAYAASNILIVSDRAANVARLAAIVDRIDKGGDRRVETIPLENASATEVVRVIEQLRTEAAERTPAAANFSVIADERTNSVVLAGDSDSRLRVRAIVADLDTPVERNGGTQVVYLNYADAETLATVLQSYLDQGRAQRTGGEGGGRPSTGPVNVIAEPGANALVVNAPADTMRDIRQVIDKLDIRRGQVLVEAIIAEVSMDRSRELGVDLAVYDRERIASASILDPDTLQAVSSLASDGTPLGLIQQGLNVAAGERNDGGTSFAILLKALSGDANTNVLSTPSLLTRDNEEARIQVGQEVPFITGQFTNTGTGQGVTNPFQTVERRDVGLTLTITPQISAGNTIQLAIAQEISSIAQGTSGAVDLITNNRTLNTSVEVEDGQILVLGGLIDDTLQESQQKVPILGDIPLLGALFRSQSVERMKRNLLNFIRPTILRGEGAADYHTRRKYDYVRELQGAQRRTNIPLLPGTSRPLLPPFERYQRGEQFPGDVDPPDRPDRPVPEAREPSP